MLSAGFTPGPWEVSDYRHDGRLVILADGGNTQLAYVAVGEGDVEDATLMRAAPALYAGLARAIRLIEDAEKDTYWTSGDGPDADSATIELRKTLAKARGETA